LLDQIGFDGQHLRSACGREGRTAIDDSMGIVPWILRVPEIRAYPEPSRPSPRLSRHTGGRLGRHAQDRFDRTGFYSESSFVRRERSTVPSYLDKQTCDISHFPAPQLRDASDRDFGPISQSIEIEVKDIMINQRTISTYFFTSTSFSRLASVLNARRLETFLHNASIQPSAGVMERVSFTHNLIASKRT
jgi:hypothetical protein